MGFYADSGFGRTLSADPSYTERVNVSPTSDMEFVAEDALPLRGDTPAARVSTGGQHAVVDGDGRVQDRRAAAPPPPALVASARRACRSARTAGGASPAAKTLAVSNTGGGTLNWTASESASWLSVSPASGTNARHDHRDARRSRGLAAGTYTTDVDGHGGGRDRFAEDDPGDAHGRSADAAGAVGDAGEPVVQRDARAARARRPRR